MALPTVKAYLPGAEGGHRAPAPHHAAPKPASKPKAAKPPHQRIHAAAQVLGAPRQKPWTEMGPGQLRHFVTKTVQQSTKSELAPFQRRGQEINAQEGNVAGRYAGYGKATDTLLGGIQGEAAQSAKTFENQVAQNALNAAKGVETSGQELAGRAGGMGPQLAAQLQAEKANLAGIGAAQQGAAGQLGQSESNFMSNLRAAAAQRVTEGQGQIAGAFGKQRGENQGKESDLLGKQGGRISSLLTELTQKQFNNRATEAGLGIKQNTLTQKAHEGSANRGQKERASQRSAAVQERGQNIQKEQKEADRTFKLEHPAGSTSKAPKAPSPAEGRKYEKELSRAEQIAREHLGGQKYNRGRQEAVRKYLSNAYGGNGDVVSAALNLAVYGKLGPQDRKTAEAYGLNGHMRPQWWGH